LKETLGELFASFENYLLLVADRNLPDDMRAKVAPSDIFQQTYIEAQRHIKHFGGTSERDLIAWLRQILLNNVRDAVRQYQSRQKRQVSREVPLNRFDADEYSTGMSESPSQLAHANEESRRLHLAIAQLPRDYRKVITLRSLERRPFAEVAKIMGRSEDASRKLWLRALEQLNRFLSPVDSSLS
jgi:RNA polymerase sigma-70 factor (ECF subfamily)